MLSRKLRIPSLLIAAALTLAACKDTADPEPEPQVATMRLTIGATGTNTQTVNVASNGAVTGGPISIRRNVATPITVAWLRADGSVDPIATTSEFQLEVASLTPTTISFTRTGDFAGTLTGTAITTTGTGQFSLFHKAEQHPDFGPFSVPITVTQ